MTFIQLDKAVQYHKAMADPTRLRMLILLAKGEMSGQQLAEKLHLSPPTVTHHASKLREAALIAERRDKNTIYFALNEYFIRQYAQQTVGMILGQELGRGESDMESDDKINKLADAVIRNFFTKEGRLKQIPVQYKKKLIALEHMVKGLTPGRKYAEKELNEYIKTYHEDYATIRREFIMHQFMYRENQIYEVNPVELWTKWQDVK